MTEAAILFALFYISIGWVIAIFMPSGYDDFRRYSLFILWPAMVVAVLVKRVRSKK
jgi:hypothetical protein